tara:strand:- start:755 stop:1144 length:390 start_codon:yes stop_codon:yes gene_type:complete
MKLSQLKTIVKEAVREAIQEEMKDILLEAVRSPKQTIYETSGTPQTNIDAPGPMNPVMQTSMPEGDRMAMRENIQSVLGGMMPGANGTISANTNSMPLQMTGNVDTASPNGSLPEGDVSINQIMGLMKK